MARKGSDEWKANLSRSLKEYHVTGVLKTHRKKRKRVSHPPYWTSGFRPWVIFDLDGTLADITHRLGYIKPPIPKMLTHDTLLDEHDFKPDWPSFNAACTYDDLKPRIAELLLSFHKMHRKIAIFTGRDETYQQPTKEWLLKKNIHWDLLVMRPAKDYRVDHIVKKEMFNKHFTKEDIWLVVDDRDQVVKMWRELGLTTLQCQNGDY